MGGEEGGDYWAVFPPDRDVVVKRTSTLVVNGMLCSTNWFSWMVEISTVSLNSRIRRPSSRSKVNRVNAGLLESAVYCETLTASESGMGVS